MIAFLTLMLAASALDRPAPLPKPLKARKMKLPAPQSFTLSNGLEVIIATNNEVPLWEARLVLQLGEFADPAGQEGRVHAMINMLDEGANGKSATEMAVALKGLAGAVHTYTTGGGNISVIEASGIKRNLDPILDIWADVITKPTFGKADWERIRGQQIEELKQKANNPNDIARVAWGQVVYGDNYIGRNPTENNLKAITTTDLKLSYAQLVGPQKAKLYVGGDVNAKELVKMLEAKIGKWAPESEVVKKPEAIPKTLTPTLYFVDKPGAAQTVIRTATVIKGRNNEAYYPFAVANQAFGRSFTARVNMNLREDKGYTYGARCFILNSEGPSIHVCSTAVQTAVTGESLTELKKEFEWVLGDKPITDEETENFSDSMVYSWPGRFETTGRLLDEYVDMWIEGLPKDHVSGYTARIRKVNTKQANEAFRSWIDLNKTSWVVVGDKSVVGESLSVLGLPVVELDTNGKPLK